MQNEAVRVGTCEEIWKAGKKMKKKIIKGYKVFNPDWTCRGFKYKVGEEYKMDDDIAVCERGFHFCKKLVDCFEFYAFDSKNKVAEIEALGIVKNKKGDIKSVTNHIKIVKELSWYEVCDLVNSGTGNSGYYNSGDCNSGNRNSGDCNRGNRNSGNWNSGDWNSGNYNSGNWNSGDYNSGNWNSGDYNSGNRNSGYCNSGDCNSGIFINTNLPIFSFNKKTKLTMNEFMEKYKTAMNTIIFSEFPLTKWISKENMTDEEKEKYPYYETTGGYLRTNTYKQAWAEAWKLYSEKEKQAIQKLPNFDKDIFKDITGIDIESEQE